MKQLRAEIFVDGQEIVSIQPFFARREMVLLILEFSQPLHNPIFNGKKYLLVKWIQGTVKEAEINNLVRNIRNVLPALGYSFTGQTLDELLGIEASVFSSLIENINRNSDDSGRRVVTQVGYLSATRKSPTTLIFMPFSKMLSLDKYLDSYLARIEDLSKFFDDVRRAIDEAIQGLNELGIAHGDLALRNIGVILDEEFNVIGFCLFDFGGNSCRQYDDIQDALESNFQIHAVLNSAKAKYENMKNKTPETNRKRKREHISEEKENQSNEGEISPLKFLASATGVRLNSQKIRLKPRSIFSCISSSDSFLNVPSLLNQDDSQTNIEAPSFDQNAQRMNPYSEFYGHENSNEFWVFSSNSGLINQNV